MCFQERATAGMKNVGFEIFVSSPYLPLYFFSLGLTGDRVKGSQSVKPKPISFYPSQYTDLGLQTYTHVAYKAKHWSVRKVADSCQEGKNSTALIVRHASKQLVREGRAVCGEHTSCPVNDLHCRVAKASFLATRPAAWSRACHLIGCARSGSRCTPMGLGRHSTPQLLCAIPRKIGCGTV